MKYLNYLLAMILISFSIVGCSSANQDDPLEGYNRFMYKTNKQVDKYTLKPISQAYKAVTPEPVQKSVTNFYRNVLEINVFANNLLQGKLRQAGLSSARFVWNSTLGLFGLFDVATYMNIRADREDFGQTLRVWGVPEGPYFIIPFVGPSTITDSVGWAGDYLMSPVSYYDWEGHNYYPLTFDVLGIIELRSSFLEAEKSLKNMGKQFDEYSIVRDVYLQKRRSLANDGAIVNNQVDDDVDKLIEEEKK